MELEKRRPPSFLLVSSLIDSILNLFQMISLLISGMLEATSGNVTIEGLDNRIHIEEVRLNLGFCPQYGK